MKTACPSTAILHLDTMPTASKPGSNLLQRGWKALLCTAALLTLGAMVPKADAQVSINIGGPPPVCSYGYYDYAPYACAPMGFYGPGYFYNGIFLGVGPWHNWGYNHGWGGHRFVGPGGGRYRPRPYRGRPGGRPGYGHGRPGYRPGPRPGPRPGARPGGARPGNGHSNARPGGARPGGGGRPNGPR